MSLHNKNMTDDFEIYIHIPFCVRKCLYCDFLSAPADEGTREDYMQALCSELKARAGEDRLKGRKVTSIFIGGGTPSVLPGTDILRLMELVRENFTLEKDCEITIETNPGTLNADKLKAYAGAGINRISMGLQSGDNAELKGLGRIHTYEDFLDSYRLALEAGFTDINVDLMSAIPGQTFESYRRTLEKVLSLEPLPTHISAYSLIVEEGTPFWEADKKGKLDLPDEDTERQMYEATKDILEGRGFHRYEISNYAREGHECRHNTGYWIGTEYLGLGLGAASLMGNRRLKNETSLAKYMADPVNCITEDIHLSDNDRMEEFMFLGLRLMEGVSKKDFLSRFGRSIQEVYGEAIDLNEKDGLMVDNGEQLALTERGISVSNYVFTRFLF